METLIDLLGDSGPAHTVALPKISMTRQTSSRADRQQVPLSDLVVVVYCPRLASDRQAGVHMRSARLILTSCNASSVPGTPLLIRYLDNTVKDRLPGAGTLEPEAKADLMIDLLFSNPSWCLDHHRGLLRSGWIEEECKADQEGFGWRRRLTLQEGGVEGLGGSLDGGSAP